MSADLGRCVVCGVPVFRDGFPSSDGRTYPLRSDDDRCSTHCDDSPDLRHHTARFARPNPNPEQETRP